MGERKRERERKKGLGVGVRHRGKGGRGAQACEQQTGNVLVRSLTSACHHGRANGRTAAHHGLGCLNMPARYSPWIRDLGSRACLIITNLQYRLVRVAVVVRNSTRPYMDYGTFSCSTCTIRTPHTLHVHAFIHGNRAQNKVLPSSFTYASDFAF